MSTHKTEIEWTHLPGHRGETWNPVRGCRRVSEGCRHCYAERMAYRFAGEGHPNDCPMMRVGKYDAGALLDGEHHREFPTVWSGGVS